MTKPSINLTNLSIILTVMIFITLGCGNSSNTNSSTSSSANQTKVIGGSVFPANEVCSYAKGSVLDKYGSLIKKWEEDVGSKDPNARYFCEPTDKSIKINDFVNDIEVSVDYDAWGNNPQGAYIIKLEYWAKSDTSIRSDVEQALRIKNLIPYCKDITKKALKTPLSQSIVEKLQNPKSISSPTGVRAKPFCEKVGQGFVCVTSNTSQSDNLIDFKIFASEESYQGYQNR